MIKHAELFHLRCISVCDIVAGWLLGCQYIQPKKINQFGGGTYHSPKDFLLLAQ